MVEEHQPEPDVGILLDQLIKLAQKEGYESTKVSRFLFDHRKNSEFLQLAELSLLLRDGLLAHALTETLEAFESILENIDTDAPDWAEANDFITSHSHIADFVPIAKCMLDEKKSVLELGVCDSSDDEEDRYDNI